MVLDLIFSFIESGVLFSGIILLVFIFFAYFIDRYSRRTFLRFKTKDNASLKIPIYSLIFCIGMNFSFYTFTPYNILFPFVQTILLILFVILGGLLFNRILKLSLADSSIKRKMDTLSLRVLQKISTWSISFICFWFIIAVLGFDISNYLIFILIILITPIAAFTLARNTLGNMIAGLIIFIWKPFKQGDFITSEDQKLSGIISGIDLMFSKLTDSNQNTVIIPNNFMLKNSSLVTSGKEYLIRINYETSNFTHLDNIRRSFVQAALMTNYVLEKPRPIVLIDDIHNNEVTLVLLAYTTKFNQLEKISSNIRTNFLKELKSLRKTNKSTRKSEYFDPEEIIY